MDFYDAHLTLQVAKIVVCLIAVLSFVYFYRSWKRIRHATSLFSFYTTSKILKKTLLVWVGMVLLLFSFAIELVNQSEATSAAIDILQMAGIVFIGYAFYVLFRNEMPKPIGISSIEQAQQATARPARPEPFKKIGSHKPVKHTHKTTKKRAERTRRKKGRK